jgi:hypothetical protein
MLEDYGNGTLMNITNFLGLQIAKEFFVCPVWVAKKDMRSWEEERTHVIFLLANAKSLKRTESRRNDFKANTPTFPRHRNHH